MRQTGSVEDKQWVDGLYMAHLSSPEREEAVVLRNVSRVEYSLLQY